MKSCVQDLAISPNEPGIWHLNDWHAVRDSDGLTFYVRELLDVYSAEFMFCKLSYQGRLAIIESVGEAAVLQVMVEIMAEKGRTYSADIQGLEDMTWLRQLAVKDAQENLANSDEAG